LYGYLVRPAPITIRVWGIVYLYLGLPEPPADKRKMLHTFLFTNHFRGAGRNNKTIMFDDCSLEEKMVICALYKETINQIKTNTFTKVPYDVARVMGVPARHPQSVICTLSYITQLNLGEDMVKNCQISQYVWDGMSYDKRRRFILSLMELKTLPEVKENSSIHMGINCVIRDVLWKVEPEFKVNAMAGQFWSEKYGYKGEVTTTM
jgi:hypothetical protein